MPQKFSISAAGTSEVKWNNFWGEKEEGSHLRSCAAQVHGSQRELLRSERRVFHLRSCTSQVYSRRGELLMLNWAAFHLRSWCAEAYNLRSEGFQRSATSEVDSRSEVKKKKKQNDLVFVFSSGLGAITTENGPKLQRESFRDFFSTPPAF